MYFNAISLKEVKFIFINLFFYLHPILILDLKHSMVKNIKIK